MPLQLPKYNSTKEKKHSYIWNPVYYDQMKEIHVNTCAFTSSSSCGSQILKHLLDKATKHQSYLPVSKEKEIICSHNGKRNPVIGEQLPAIHPLASLAPFPSVHTSLVLTVYDLLLQTDLRVALEGAGQAPLLLGALVGLLALSWAPGDGLLVDWCHGGWKWGRLIPGWGTRGAREAGRLEGNGCQEWNGGGRKLSSSKGVCPCPPGLWPRNLG